MPFHCTPPLEQPVQTLCRRPWSIRCKPFQVAANTWYIAGQSWVSCYLIDTGDGLILIDTGLPESLYLLVDSIYRAGFRPEDIRKILLSHAHFDHCGAAAALREITGAEIYMSREDHRFMKEAPDEVFYPQEGSHMQVFEPDRFYAEGEPVVLGNAAVETVLTPGHTPGCTSFFWSVAERDGTIRRIGMHGGIGANTMTDEYYATSRAMGPGLRRRFLEDLPRLAQMKVDIALPSHPNQIEIMDQAGEYEKGRQPYLDPTVWGMFLKKHFDRVSALETGPLPGSG